MEARPRRLPAVAVLVAVAGLLLAVADGAGRCGPEVLVLALWGHGLLGLAAGVLLQRLPGPWRSWRGPPSGPVATGLLLAAVASIVVLRSGASSPPPARPGAPDLLLLTLDTTRADRWRATAAADGTLEAGAVLFDLARSTSGLTAPAHASLLTGRMPHATGVTNNGAVLPALPALPGLLRAAGWHTMAAPSVLHLDPAFGFGQGFVAVAPVEDGLAGRLRAFRDFRLARLLLRLLGAGRVVRPGEETLAAALELWQAAPRDRPRFLWVHLFEPHWPYAPSEEDLAAAAGLPPWPEVPLPGFAPEEVAVWRRRYDGEILHTRRLATSLVRALEEDALRRGRPLWVVLVGDHGEALGEHGAADHGDLLYEEQLRVPLLVRGPGVAAGRRELAVSHLDLLPSLGELLGLRPPPGLAGRSWTPVLWGAELPDRPVLAETRHGDADGAMAVWGGVKVIRTLRIRPEAPGQKPGRHWRSPAPAEERPWLRGTEIYELRRDPRELQPLAGLPAGPDPREALVELLRRRGPALAGPGPGIPSEVREALAELGYGGG